MIQSIPNPPLGLTRRSPHSHELGITFIEGLLVFAAIVIICAVIYPVFIQGRGGSRISCSSNMKQLGLGLMQYGQDYDGVLPAKQSTFNGSTVSWRVALNPYIKSRTIYQCPTTAFAKLPDLEHDGFPRSYAVNGSHGGHGEIGGPYLDSRRPLNVTKVNSPTNTILIVDSTAAFPDFDPLMPSAFATPTVENSPTGHLKMHQDRSNFMFVDGHVKALEPLTTLGMSTDQRINYWTLDNSPYSSAELKTAQATLQYAVEKDER